jgi:hypothetical protein
VLFFVLCFTKTFWQHFTFNHYRHNIGIILSVVSAIANTALCITLVVLLGLREAWLPFGFMLPEMVYYGLTVCWSAHIARHHFDPDW